MRKDKLATAEYHRKWYQKNKEVRKKQLYARRAKHQTGLRTLVWDYLAAHPCVDCGCIDQRVLEFDHVNDDKDLDIAGCIQNCWSTKRLVAEIAKCEVRCSNCHRIITQQRQNSWRARFFTARKNHPDT